MQGVPLRIIDISWRRQVLLEYDMEQEKYLLPPNDQVLLNKSGFYVLYGRHPVYGRDALLYIGETKESEYTSRKFRDRLGEHLKGKFWYFQDLAYALGTVDEPLTAEDVLAVESILIAAHKPAMNIRDIYCARDSVNNLLVRNWNFPGSLLPECSGRYWRQS